MDNIISDEYSLYWETNMFLRNEELNNSNWGFDDALSVHSDSSSPDGSGAWSASSSPTSKNIVSERNRRKKLNESLFALRATVPNISKMNKASIIKDAINYIQQLQKEEKRIQAEISDLEYSKSGNGIKDEGHNVRPKKTKTASSYVDSPVEDIECNISYMGDTTMAVSLMCSKRRDTMVKLCEVFESLGVKVITANITSSSRTLFKTLLLQVDSEEKDAVKAKIEAAIATLSDPHI